MLDRARSNPKIHFVMNTVVDEIHHEGKWDRVTGVTLRDTVTGQQKHEDIGAVFVAIGHVPNTEIFRGQLDMDADGYLITGPGPRTKIGGVFACGDVQDRVYRQAITAAGSGCMAAIEAERFLEAEGH